jgi:hypothetical protein
MEREVTLLLLAPIHVHVLLLHLQQRQHPIMKEVLCQSKRPRHVLIMDRLVILPSGAPTSVSYRPQPKATRMWHKLWPIGSATIVDKRVTLLTFVPIRDATVMCQR